MKSEEQAGFAREDRHLEQLLALCLGLEIEHVDLLLSREPEVFLELGKEMARRIKARPQGDQP